MIRIFSICIIYLLALGANAKELKIASGNISKAMFSPDGKLVSWAVKVGRRHSIFIRRADGLDEAKKLFTPLYKRTFYSWSPDSKSIACSGKQGRKKILTLIDVASGKSKILGEGFNPVFMPSGKKLLFFTLNNLCVIELKSGKIKKLSNFPQRQSFERIAVAGQNIYFSCNGDLWSATLEKQAKMLVDHKRQGITQPFIQNPVASPDNKTVYVSLITDGLYAHATDNILGRYTLNSDSMKTLTEANSWTMRPDGRQIIYCLGGELKIYPGNKKICRGSEPIFSPNGRKLLYLVSSGWDDPAKLMIRTMTLVNPSGLNEISYPCSSDNSMQPAMWYAPVEQQHTVPLLVGLHTWSGNYRQSSGKSYYKQAAKRGWAFIFPNFRGPNRTPDAMGSDKAVQDIVDAVKYAKSHANIDPNRIYLCGASGGGFMAMLMAGRHPEIWAGVSAWCGISDIKAWHAYNKKKKSGYYRHIESALGGAPDTDKQAAIRAVRRSPVTWLKNAEKLPLDIWHGAKDKIVPATEGKNAFTVVVGSEIPDDATHPAKIGKYKILSRKTFNTTRLTIFNSGHTILYSAAIEWLALQCKGKPVVWNHASGVTDSNKIEK
ncbi:MAG: prolyl oligopeptidase family serine peptidase [Victivallaceae bacterium]|nr:prolyl oligopeptidase family serine peptidase [Victivallaceae bacterium]